MSATLYELLCDVRRHSPARDRLGSRENSQRLSRQHLLLRAPAPPATRSPLISLCLSPGYSTQPPALRSDTRGKFELGPPPPPLRGPPRRSASWQRRTSSSYASPTAHSRATPTLSTSYNLSRLRRVTAPGLDPRSVIQFEIRELETETRFQTRNQLRTTTRRTDKHRHHACRELPRQL